MPSKVYNTYSEAEEVRSRKQKQFPNFYVKIIPVKRKSWKRTKYTVVVA